MKRFAAKTLVLFAVLSSVVATTLPRRASAGAIMLGLDYLGNDRARVSGIGLMGGVLVVGGIGFAVAGVPLGYLFIVLDADGNVPQAELARALVQKFSFLADQNEAVSELAAAISEQAKRVDLAGSKGNVEISVPASQTEAILGQTNLTPEQVAQVAASLQ
jgi:hypothetical protein